MLTVRCSALPLAMTCPGSVQPSKVPINSINDAAQLGTAAHVGLREVAETGTVGWDALPELAQRYGVDEDELRMLVATGAKLWPEVAKTFPEALTEVELRAQMAPGFVLTGHIDLLSVTLGVARAGDWKSGRKDSDYRWQLLGYGALVLHDDPQLTEVTSAAIWLRTAEIENYTLKRSDLSRVSLEIVDTIAGWDGTYHPGKHCEFCPRSHECEAANALMRRDVAAVADKALVARAETELASMRPEEILDVYRKAKRVSGMAARINEAIRNHVLKHGDIDAGSHRLTVDVEHRRELDPLKAWPVLDEAGFDDEDFAAAVKLSVTKVEKRIASKAVRGKGAAAVRKLKAALEEADAVSVKETPKLREVRS